MGNQVYANGMEVSCKAGDGKSICSFPDVCFTPPQTPATPPGVPIPYPNTGVDSDSSDGSASVKVSGEEVMLKNKSCFKTSKGDEAGSTPKKGMINGKTSGKVYFTAWSMDVMIEGENAVRHLDVTTHNHGSTPNAFAPWPRISRARPATDSKTKPCEEACKRKRVSRKKKDSLRDTPEYKDAAVRVNSPPPPPKKCPTCKEWVDRLSPDHMLPLNHMRKMPGFACLPDEKQSQIANHKDNMVGLCASCNSSKKDKLWPAWKGNQAKGVKFSKALREVSSRRTERIQSNSQTRINNVKC